MMDGLGRSIAIISILILLASHKPATWGTAWINIKKVTDGDSFKGDILNLPDWIGKDVSFRVYGIDTPEKDWRASCPKEFVLAIQAKTVAESMVLGVQKVEISRKDKYGRFLIKLPKYSDMLLQDSLAYPYFGKTKQNPFCK